MTRQNYEQLFLTAGIDELKKYLLSEEIYWPLSVRNPSGTSPYPRFTLGWLLLFWRRWECLTISQDDQTEFEHLADKMTKVRSNWQSAWEKKAADEFSARLTLWKNFINDYRKNPSEHANRYTYECQRRIILTLLSIEIREIPPETQTLLAGMDKMLSSVFLPGEFIWDKVFEKAFPEDVFWYLYGKLKG